MNRAVGNILTIHRFFPAGFAAAVLLTCSTSGSTMVSQLVEHERIETTIAKASGNCLEHRDAGTRTGDQGNGGSGGRLLGSTSDGVTVLGLWGYGDMES